MKRAPYQVTFAESLSPEGRADLAKRLAAVKPWRAPSPRSRPSMATVGEKVLAAPDAPDPGARKTTIVRIAYRSMGGELLAFETAPLSASQAASLESEYDGAISFHVDKRPAMPRGMRLVVLPSQSTERVERSEEVSPPTPIDAHPMRRYALYTSRRLGRAA